MCGGEVCLAAGGREAFSTQQSAKARAKPKNQLLAFGYWLLARANSKPKATPEI
jgi:hypothetical protein